METLAMTNPNILTLLCTMTCCTTSYSRQLLSGRLKVHGLGPYLLSVNALGYTSVLHNQLTFSISRLYFITIFKTKALCVNKPDDQITTEALDNPVSISVSGKQVKHSHTKQPFVHFECIVVFQDKPENKQIKFKKIAKKLSRIIL